MEKLNYKILNILLIIIAIFFVSKSLDIYKNFLLVLLDILLPIFLSFFIGYSLYPCVKYFNKKLSYNLSCFFVIIICVFMILSLIYSSISIFMKEANLISQDISYFLAKTPFTINDLKEYLSSFLSLDKGISLINSGTLFITKFIIIIVLSIYFLFNMENIKTYFKKYKLFRMIDKDLFNYYKGFYLVIILEILEYFIIYFLIGHPYFLLISVMSGITTVIPFFGALFTNFLALISAYSIAPSLFIKTAIVMIIIPLFNSYIIEPKIYHKTLKVSLISIIISCFTFGMLFGFIGIILAIPLFLIIKNLFIFFLLRHKKI